MDRFSSKQKAMDLALWQNHNHRFGETYAVALSYTQGDYMVIPTAHPSFEKDEFEKLPKNYTKMSCKHIQQIRMDVNPFLHWEEIVKMVSNIHGETLRFILSAKIPLDKFIRYELATRGDDKEFNWVGFDKAKQIWFV